MLTRAASPPPPPKIPKTQKPNHQPRRRFPSHLIAPLVRSFDHDHYVEDTGDIVYYKSDPAFPNKEAPASA